MSTRRILLTGVTRGLGRVLAVRFAELGHQVLGCGRSAEALASLGQVLGQDQGQSHRLKRLDVTNGEAVEAWARELLSEVGAPDLLVNNAALINRPAPLWEVPADEFSRVVDVNVKGVAHVIRHFLPAMIARGSGVVVNLSSGWGRSTSPEVAPYCATKFAIEGLTQALAQELPPGLAAVPLSPGVVHTDMLDTAYGAEAASYPGPEAWVDVAAPYILGLGPKDNGKSLRVPFN